MAEVEKSNLSMTEPRLAINEKNKSGDESWCLHWEPESKTSTMQCYHSSSPCPKQFKSHSSAGKVMLTLFFDSQGPLLMDFHAFGSFKKSLKGRRFLLDVEVQQAVSDFSSNRNEFYQRGIFNLVKQWDDCLNAQGAFA